MRYLLASSVLVSGLLLAGSADAYEVDFRGGRSFGKIVVIDQTDTVGASNLTLQEVQNLIKDYKNSQSEIQSLRQKMDKMASEIQSLRQKTEKMEDVIEDMEDMIKELKRAK